MLVPDNLRKTVFFIGTKTQEKFIPRATAFLTAATELGVRLGFLVTAQHVVAKAVEARSQLWLRVNLKDGGVEETPILDDAWWFSPETHNRTDVAVCQIVIGDEEDVHAVDLNGSSGVAATEDVIKNRHIGVGDEVAIVGLFRSHYGLKRNVPVVRIGNIAAMPEEPVHTSEYGSIEAYLIETRSIGGLSGSPVFVSMPPTRIVNGRTEFTTGAQFYLLGLMHGHFDIQNLNDDVVVDGARDATQNINTGMGVVIPVSKIMDIIFEPERSKQRREKIIESRGGT